MKVRKIKINSLYIVILWIIIFLLSGVSDSSDLWCNKGINIINKEYYRF